MQTRTSSFRAILRVLVEHKVKFIVVGGVSAVLQAAPIQTFDLDIVHARSAANLERLQGALAELDAYYRELTDRRIRPQLPHLDTSGHILLTTSAGHLDVLGTIGDNLGYRELLKYAVQLEIEPGLSLNILRLEKNIEIKEKLARDVDRAVLPVLRRTLEERQRSKGRRKR
jgi:predicted nucleotidyltransferase